MIRFLRIAMDGLGNGGPVGCLVARTAIWVVRAKPAVRSRTPTRSFPRRRIGSNALHRDDGHRNRPWLMADMVLRQTRVAVPASH